MISCGWKLGLMVLVVATVLGALMVLGAVKIVGVATAFQIVAVLAVWLLVVVIGKLGS
jgi:hypothetical protein